MWVRAEGGGPSGNRGTIGERFDTGKRLGTISIGTSSSVEDRRNLWERGGTLPDVGNRENSVNVGERLGTEGMSANVRVLRERVGTVGTSGTLETRGTFGNRGNVWARPETGRTSGTSGYEGISWHRWNSRGTIIPVKSSEKRENVGELLGTGGGTSGKPESFEPLIENGTAG